MYLRVRQIVITGVTFMQFYCNDLGKFQEP
jgi:hypothetical protein